MNIITIDTGTTNTRVKLWQDDLLLASSHIGVGVRDTSISGSKDKLITGVSAAVQQAIAQAPLDKRDIGLFLASGMITSNVGLHEIPHAIAPAGRAELAAAMAATVIPQITAQPIWFVPGVRNRVAQVTTANCAEMDMMRGEEVEALALLDHLQLQGPALLVLPGSHTKFVFIDSEGRIAGCITTLAGELLSVLTMETILASALDKSFAARVDPAMAQLGAQHAERFGVTRTCFSTRILDQFTASSQNEKANFLAGAIIHTDLTAIKGAAGFGDCRDIPVILGGSNTMAGVFAVLIAADPYFRGTLTTVASDEMKDMAARGAMLVARERGLCSI